MNANFKHSEAGFIPNEWIAKSYDDVLRKHPTKRHQITTSKYQSSGEHPVVDQSKDAICAYCDVSDKLFIVPDGGAIVFGDHTCNIKHVNFDFVVGADGTQILTAKTGHAAKFIAYDLQNRPIEATGYNRHFKYLKERAFVSPPEVEQTSIVQALSDMDDLIASLDALIAKKRGIKQGAMQQLLTGKRRLPAYRTETLQTTEFGRFPSDWKPVPLASLTKAGRAIRYGIVQPGEFDPNGRYMIRGQDYSAGWAAEETVFRVSDRIEQRYANARVATGDLIITIVGYCGIVEQIPPWLDGANLTQTTARLSIDPKAANPSFVKHMLRSPLGAVQVRNCLKSGAQPGLNCGDVEKMIVFLPENINEQGAISGILDAIDDDVERLNNKLRKLQHLRRGMMQQLLTGRIRLS